MVVPCSWGLQSLSTGNLLAPSSPGTRAAGGLNSLPELGRPLLTRQRTPIPKNHLCAVRATPLKPPRAMSKPYSLLQTYSGSHHTNHPWLGKLGTVLDGAERCEPSSGGREWEDTGEGQPHGTFLDPLVSL